MSRERSKSQEIDPPNVGDPHREEEVPSRPRSDSLSFEEGKRKESKARRKASRKNTLPDETSDSRKRTESQRKKSSGSKVSAVFYSKFVDVPVFNIVRCGAFRERRPTKKAAG